MVRPDEATLPRTNGPQNAGGVEGSPRLGRAESDRARLAYALHDGLTQVVTASVLELEWLARHAEVGPAEAAEALRAASRALRTSLDEIRGVLEALTPSDRDHIQPIEELLRSVTERWHVPATWTVEGDTSELPAQVLEAASSVIREGVANAAKHSQSDAVAINVHASDRSLQVSVEDRGRGFRDDGPRAGHLGLELLRRRVAAVDGTLDVRSVPGEGTRVVAELPVERPEDEQEGSA